MVDGPAAALREVERLERDKLLTGYRYTAAIKADFLRRLGRHAEAAAAYEQAMELADNEVERAFLAMRLAESAPG
jgi:RNA polymerase sigma-70 factor, ECF subfamily